MGEPRLSCTSCCVQSSISLLLRLKTNGNAPTLLLLPGFWKIFVAALHDTSVDKNGCEFSFHFTSPGCCEVACAYCLLSIALSDF